MRTLQDLYEEEDNEDAYDLLPRIESFHLLFLLYRMCDILKIIKGPEVYFKKNVLTISEFTKEINLCVTHLDLLYEGDDKGFYLDKFLKEFDQKKREYRGYLLIYRQGEKLKYLEEISTN